MDASVALGGGYGAHLLGGVPPQDDSFVRPEDGDVGRDVGRDGGEGGQLLAREQLAALNVADTEAELQARAAQYAAALQALWVEDTGLFLNKRLDTGEFSPRIAPTHFYPLLAKAATPAQAAPDSQRKSESLDEMIARRVNHLSAYQDAAYARRYSDLVALVRQTESARMPGQTALACTPVPSSSRASACV